MVSLYLVTPDHSACAYLRSPRPVPGCAPFLVPAVTAPLQSAAGPRAQCWTGVSGVHQLPWALQTSPQASPAAAASAA
eukprot:8956418-Pyramimonas_sp.AAC.1